MDTNANLTTQASRAVNPGSPPIDLAEIMQEIVRLSREGKALSDCMRVINLKHLVQDATGWSDDEFWRRFEQLRG